MTTCECFIQNTPNQIPLKEDRYSIGKSGSGLPVKTQISTPGSHDLIVLDHGASDTSPVDVYLLPDGKMDKRILVRILLPGEKTSFTGPDLRTRTLVHKGSTTSVKKDNLDENRKIVKNRFFEGFK